MTQTERVLAQLRRAGPHGITAVSFAAPNIIDGGPPIMRVAARIAELRNAGHKIIDGGRKGAVKRYVLEEPTRAPEGVKGSSDAVSRPTPTQADVPALWATHHDADQDDGRAGLSHVTEPVLRELRVLGRLRRCAAADPGGPGAHVRRRAVRAVAPASASDDIERSTGEDHR